MDDSPRAVLRNPFPNHAWPQVWDWIQPYRRSVMEDHPPATMGEFVEQQLFLVETSLYRTSGVLRDDEVGGLITLETLRACWGLGGPAERGLPSAPLTGQRVAGVV